MKIRSSILFLGVFAFTPVTHAAERFDANRCVAELWMTADTVPAQIGARPSALREYAKGTRLLVAQLEELQRPEDAPLVQRIRAWLVGIDRWIAAAGASDEPLPGFVFMGLSELDGSAVLGPDEADPTLFETVVKLLAGDPRATPAPEHVRGEIADGVTKLLTRNSPEDVLLSKIAAQWVWDFDSAHRAPPDRARVELTAFHRLLLDMEEKTLEDLKVAIESSAYRLAFAHSPARRLSLRERLVYFHTFPGVEAVFAQIAVAKLQSYTRLDPKHIGASVKALERRIAVVDAWKTLLTPHSITARRAGAWAAALRERISNSQGASVLDGYFVVGLTGLGQGRLAPADMDLSFHFEENP